MTLLDMAAAACLITGAGLCLIAGVGLVRFTTTLERMHPGTKPQVLGVLLILIAMWLRNPTWAMAGPLAITGLAQVITVSVAAHIVGRASYQAGAPGDDGSELPARGS
ncbi:monovalent cation/H(+) antiporter subunit G [Nonomuraea cavernae]|uniref:monovalent cation/H(+) antiporter subunit G n=1 Tax=Nonomuraea cavernae TaxID=2045107 RepID=UPI0033C8D17C